MIMGGGLVGGYGMGAGLVGGRRAFCRKACRRDRNGRFVKCTKKRKSFKICYKQVTLKHRKKRKTRKTRK